MHPPLRRRDRRLRQAVVGTLVATALPAVAAVSPAFAARAAGRGQGGTTPPDLPCFNPKVFSNPATVDNKWLNLLPGTRITLSGQRLVDGVLTTHDVIITITDLTKVVNGVRTQVMWEQDIDDGNLHESELAFNAQDDQGTVWNLGEYPEEIEDDGTVTGAPNTWIAGLDGARAGIFMQAHPKVGDPSYVQGYSPNIDFYDRGQTVATGLDVTVPAGTFHKVLKVDESAPLAPEDGHQQKYYAPHVGLIQVIPAGGEAEALKLTALDHLNDKQMAKVRKTAKDLDRHGRATNPIYKHTPPVQPR